jgi:hypothetical protein
MLLIELMFGNHLTVMMGKYSVLLWEFEWRLVNMILDMITISSVLVGVLEWSVVNRGSDMITITSVLVRVLAWSVVNRGIDCNSNHINPTIHHTPGEHSNQY